MKFKNIKKKGPPSSEKKTQSPSNSRTIPANFPLFKFSFPKFDHVTLVKAYRGTLKTFVALAFMVAVVIMSIDLQNNLKVSREIDPRRISLTQDLHFWEKFIAQHQNYPDAYFQASILEYQLGEVSKARTSVENGLSLDPNSENGRKIEDFLKNKFYF